MCSKASDELKRVQSTVGIVFAVTYTIGFVVAIVISAYKSYKLYLETTKTGLQKCMSKQIRCVFFAT